MSESELIVSDPVAQALAAQLAEMGQWVAYAQACAAKGDEKELTMALDTIEGYRIEIAKHAELTSGVMTGMTGVIETLSKEVEALNEQVVELEDNFEEHAADMAQSMVESELDWIFGSEEEESDARIRHTARQMMEYSIDEIKEAERQATENRLREAEAIAMHDLSYTKDLGPDSFDLEDEDDETEEA